MNQNIVISELTQNGYEELYPKTTASQINGVVAKASHSLNSDQLGGIDSNSYATKEYIDRNFAKSIMGSYTGNGEYERNNVIIYEKKPKFILISGTQPNPNYCGCAGLFADNRYCLVYGMRNGVIYIENADCIWNESNIGFKVSSLLNFTGVIYNYIMIY